MTQEPLEYDKTYLREMESFVGNVYEGTWIAEQKQGGSIHFESEERTIVFTPHNLGIYRWRDITPNAEPLDTREILFREALENKGIASRIISLLVERMTTESMQSSLSHIAFYLEREEVAEILKYAISYASSRDGESLALAAIVHNSTPIDQEKDES